jgi:hypothetical protein
VAWNSQLPAATRPYARTGSHEPVAVRVGADDELISRDRARRVDHRAAIGRAVEMQRLQVGLDPEQETPVLPIVTSLDAGRKTSGLNALNAGGVDGGDVRGIGQIPIRRCRGLGIVRSHAPPAVTPM